MSETPSKYTPEPRVYEQKTWLYEKYWVEFLSTREIATEAGVSPDTIKRRLRSNGIPRRSRGVRREDNLSMFTDFYRDDERVPLDPTTVQSTASFEGRDPRELNWQKDARENEAVGDGAVIDDWEPGDSEGEGAPYRYTVEAQEDYDDPYANHD